MKTFRLARPGKNALTSTIPSDYSFSSDWNTPNIVKEATINPTLGTNASESFTEVAHGLNYTPFVIGFCKFANDRVGLIGCKASNANFFSTNLRVNATNVRFGYLNTTGGNYAPKFKYMALEIPLSGTPAISDPGGRRIVITKPGFDARTELNPNNKIYDSQFGTLKYFSDDITTVVVPTATPSANVTEVYETVLATHNLGYYPFFGANQEYSVDDPGRVLIMPIVFGDAGYYIYDMIYTTTTQLIFRREYGNSFGGLNYPAQTLKIYWKLFSKDLGL